MKPYNLLHRCYVPDSATSGKLLAHAKEQVSVLREKIEIRVCVFKIGITTNPPMRFCSYLENNYECMWVVAECKSLDKINMLEAALVSHFEKHVGCRNSPGTGGEGGLNKRVSLQPPYFAYVAAARADQPRWVG